MSELENMMRDANINMMDVDSIIDIPYKGVPTKQIKDIMQLNKEKEADKLLDKYLFLKETFLDFYDSESLVDVYLGKNFKRLSKSKLKEKLLVCENFKALNQVLSMPDILEYSPESLYAACSYRKDSLEQLDADHSVRSILKKEGLDQLRNEYPLTEEKLKLMQRIHDVKKKKGKTYTK